MELNEKNFERLAESLNTKEKRVAKLVALGKKNREIAAELNYSLVGVKKLVSQIYDKTGLSRDELRDLITRPTCGLRRFIR
ncbi:MAG: LuxR C-terminal-related transcriptional regulator [Synergistaceae bacterium]|nr:LuxR C-terminal-related transcriptional regulator [Synergistaceae bacterium]